MNKDKIKKIINDVLNYIIVGFIAFTAGTIYSDATRAVPLPEKEIVYVEKPVYVQSDTAEDMVYITKSGSKYHREDCGYLKTKIPMTKSNSEELHYEPCKKCNP